MDGLQPLAAPLAVSGVSRNTLKMLAADFLPLGFHPIQAGGSSSGSKKRKRGYLAPGSAMGVLLARET